MKTGKITKQRLRELVLEELTLAQEGNPRAQMVPVPISILTDIIYAGKHGKSQGGLSLQDMIAGLEDHLRMVGHQSGAHFDAHAFANSREE